MVTRRESLEVAFFDSPEGGTAIIHSPLGELAEYFIDRGLTTPATSMSPSGLKTRADFEVR